MLFIPAALTTNLTAVVLKLCQTFANKEQNFFFKAINNSLSLIHDSTLERKIEGKKIRREKLMILKTFCDKNENESAFFSRKLTKKIGKIETFHRIEKCYQKESKVKSNELTNGFGTSNKTERGCIFCRPSNKIEFELALEEKPFLLHEKLLSMLTHISRGAWSLQ